MINSMTGFGRCEQTDGERKVIVEIKSVNHRYCDINIKMPKALNFFEPQIRTLVKEYAQRGKIEIYITYEDARQGKSSVKYDKALAGGYLQALRQMQQDFDLTMDIGVSSLSWYPDVLTLEEQSVDEEDIWHFIRPAIEKACQGLADTRAREGQRLRDDLIAKLDDMVTHVDFIEERSPGIVDKYRTDLENKVKELLADSAIDQNRIVQETAIYADKICVDEEIVRLRSHIKAVREALSSEGAVGRKLDFLAQEMNRESNTILSKSPDLAISDHAIDLKTQVEKVREQIQNIE